MTLIEREFLRIFRTASKVKRGQGRRGCGTLRRIVDPDKSFRRRVARDEDFEAVHIAPKLFDLLEDGLGPHQSNNCKFATFGAK